MKQLGINVHCPCTNDCACIYPAMVSISCIRIDLLLAYVLIPNTNRVMAGRSNNDWIT